MTASKRAEGEKLRPVRNVKGNDSNAVVFGFAGIFIFLLAVFAFTAKLPAEILLLYVAASVVAFLAYALDKSAARNGRRRVAEAHLHLLSLAGGWPGALFAQRKLRHKSRKTSFQVAFWMTVLLNVAAFAWLFTADGTAFLDSIETG